MQDMILATLLGFAGGNGQTSAIEHERKRNNRSQRTKVATVGNNITPVNYDYNIFGYSVGANYAINDKMQFC